MNCTNKTLCQKITSMETKKYTQFGTFSVIIMLPLFLLFTGLLIKSAVTNSPDLFIYMMLSATFLLCLLIFFRLTITVDNKYVTFKLGIGPIGKAYKISDISSCKPVRNSIFSGFGIRMLPYGWLYNVSGLESIELQFNNRSSIVRIGTDKPEEISKLIQSLIGGGIAAAEGNKSMKKQISNYWLFTLLLIPAILMVVNFRETKVQLDDKTIQIKGVYGLTIPFTELEQVDTISALPAVSLRTNGYAFFGTWIGNFKLTDGSRVKMFVKNGHTPYILIKSKDRLPVYINFDDRIKTIKLYNELIVKK